MAIPSEMITIGANTAATTDPYDIVAMNTPGTLKDRLDAGQRDETCWASAGLGPPPVDLP